MKKLLVILPVVILILFLSGCTSQPSDIQYEKTEGIDVEHRTENERIDIEEGLGNLCTSQEECFIFCQGNRVQCEAYCSQNPENELCISMRSFFGGSEADFNQSSPSKAQFGVSGLPECASQKLTVSPVEQNKIYEIVPLGNLNPPDHTLPTEHMYFWLGEEPPVSSVDIKVPGDLYLIRIQSTSYLDKGREDYGMTFAICKDIYIYFLHIQELAPEFKALISDKDCRTSETHEGGSYRYCNTQLNRKVDVGTLLGKVGGSYTHSFDFGAYDYRIKHEFANPERYTSKTPNVICPLDLYEDATKSKLFSEVKRTVEPKCGTNVQDVKGTLQGNWFYGDATAESPEDWYKHLAFVQYNFDPKQSAISVGGVFMESGYWTFTPQHSGNINRAFSEVTSGSIYCYSGGSEDGRGGPIPGKIIVQLTSEKELKIEQQGGSCSGAYTFKSPTIYKR